VLLQKFAEENNLHIDTIDRFFDKYRALDHDGDGHIGFDQFCMLMEVEATGEYRQLFNAFDHRGTSSVDVKEFMLGLLNFTDTEKPRKIEFMFKLYDEDHNGFLTEDELIKILQANHMAEENQVLKKARTIMKQADQDGDNHINQEEFVVISEKFPNILFPALHQIK
jgi:serine/threonine-protein phosphatase 2B regulatory subunit